MELSRQQKEHKLTDKQQQLRDAFVELYLETGKAHPIRGAAMRLGWTEQKTRAVMASVEGFTTLPGLVAQPQIAAAIQRVNHYYPATWFLRGMIISLRAEAIAGRLLRDACMAADVEAGHTHIKPAGQTSRPIVAIGRHAWENVRVHLRTGSSRGDNVTLRKIDGNLEIVPTPEGVDRAKAMLEERDAGDAEAPDMQFHELLDDFWGNGWTEVRPEDVGALTGAFMMSDDGQLNDEGRWEAICDNARVYAHMNYQVEDPVEVLARGQVLRFEGAVVEKKAEKAATKTSQV